MKKVFVSMPYTHDDPEVVEYRIRVAQRMCARLRMLGFSPVSPCVFGHQFIHLTTPDAVSYEDWLSEAMDDIERCDVVFVLMVDGWDQSSGVQAEVELAHSLNKRVFHYSAWEERMEEVADEIVTTYEGAIYASFPSFIIAEKWREKNPGYGMGYVLNGKLHQYYSAQVLPLQP